MKSLVLCMMFLFCVPAFAQIKPFSNPVKEGDKVVMTFEADWCAACREMKLKTWVLPRVRAKISKFFKDKFFKIDVDENKDAVKEYKVTKLPTTIMFEIKDGKYVEIKRLEGNVPSYKMLEFLDSGAK
jgi:thiol-disulfide isomerase/thioredoxin